MNLHSHSSMPIQHDSSSSSSDPLPSSSSSLSNPLDFLLNPNPFDFPHHSAIQNLLTELPKPPQQVGKSTSPPVYSVSAFGVSDRPSPGSLAPHPGIPNGVPGAGDCAKLCPRHQRMANEGTNRALQAEIETLPESDQEAITTAWSLFSASNGHRRRLILTGLLTICCPSQLTFLSDSLRAACRTDPFSRLPRELSLRILANVDAFSLGRAAQVSRLWRKLADDDLLWRTMCQQHIERTCHKCGWGLPSMQKRSRDASRREAPDPKRPRLAAAPAQTCSPEASPPPEVGPEDATRPWKSVYTERLALERNWRKGLYRESVLSGHGDSITCLQIDEHATPWPILVTGSWDRTIRVWNVDSRATVHVLRGHTRGVRCLQFDATKLISGGMDSKLKLWNWRTGECIRTIDGHLDAVTCLNFDDELLASGSVDSTVRIWNFNTGAGFVLRGHQDWVNAVRLAGQTVFSGSDDGQIRIWDLATRQTRAILSGHVAQVQSLSLVRGPEPHRQVLVSGSLDNCLKVWDVASGTCERTMFGHIQGVWSVDADQLRIVSASHDRSLKIWDRVTGKCIHTIVGHRGAVTTVKLTDDKVVSGGDDGEVRIWWFGRPSSSSSNNNSSS